MGRLDNVLAQLRREAASAGAAGYGSFEADGNFEAVANFLVTKKGFSRADARSMAAEAMNKPGVMNAITAEMGPGGLRGLSNTQTNGNVPGRDVAAQLKLTVTRVTANIVDAPLPFAMFGVLDMENGYRQALQGLLAAGTVLTSVDIGEGDGQPNAALFTYTKGADVDTVRVECSAAPYPNVLKSTLVDIFQVGQVRVKLSDRTQATQFDQGLFPVVRNMWGRNSENNLTPADFFSPEQFQEGVIDVAVCQQDASRSLGAAAAVDRFDLGRQAAGEQPGKGECGRREVHELVFTIRQVCG